MPLVLTHVNQTLVKGMARGHWEKSQYINQIIYWSRFLMLYSFSKDQWVHLYVYRQTSHISNTLADNKIIDHSNVVAAPRVDAAPTTSSLSTSTPGFNGLNRDNSKMRLASFKIWDLVRLTFEIWRYLLKSTFLYLTIQWMCSSSLASKRNQIFCPVNVRCSQDMPSSDISTLATRTGSLEGAGKYNNTVE